MLDTWRLLLELLGMLPKGAKGFYLRYSILTALLSILDTVALSLVLLTVNPLLTGKPIELPLLGTIPAGYVGVIAVSVCVLFLTKGAFALVFQRYATKRLANFELVVGDRLFERYMRADWAERSKLSTAEVTRLIDISMARANNGFLLPYSQIPGNAFTVIAVLAVMVVGDPITALVTFIYLGIIMLLMMKVVNRKQRQAGLAEREFSFLSARLMSEMVSTLKEVTLRGRSADAGRVLHDRRAKSTSARALGAFLVYIPKYSLEASLVGGFLVVGGTGYLLGGITQGVVSITLFTAAGFRILPALTGLQNAYGSINNNMVFAREVVTELKTAKELAQKPGADAMEDTAELPESPRVLRLTNVSFSYPGDARPVLQDVSLTLPFGSSVAIVGPSGSGKSTLIDLLLGLSTPSNGSITLDGIPLTAVLKQWRRRVGYVPQKVSLFDASIAQNIALTWDEDWDEQKVRSCLQRAHLQTLLESSDGIRLRVGEQGEQLSGGQQQRLGIARALYTDPMVMVMDEATSSLDTATERRVTESLEELAGDVTFITVAHRLATIRNYDQVVYLDGGRVIGQGSFDEVIEAVPDFRVQAQLAGLI